MRYLECELLSVLQDKTNVCLYHYENTNITALKVLNFFRGSENIQGQKETSDLYKGLKLIRELSESKEDRSDLMTIRNHKNKLMFRAFVHFFLKHSKSKRSGDAIKLVKG